MGGLVWLGYPPRRSVRGGWLVVGVCWLVGIARCEGRLWGAVTWKGCAMNGGGGGGGGSRKEGRKEGRRDGG